MSLMLLLVLVCQTMASLRLPAEDPCMLEIAELKRSIRILENKLLIGAWQLDHLRVHRFFSPPRPSTRQPIPQPDPKPDPNPDPNPEPADYDSDSAESDLEPNPKPSSNETEKHKMASVTSLPPAGSLIVYDKDCSELYERVRPPSGFYRIRPKPTLEPFLTYCDMEDGGGWTIFQRRRHGRVDFNRDWVDYREGFGDFKLWNDEFWLGNEHIHSLLVDGKNLMKIDLMDWNGKKTHSIYQDFRISDEKDKYRLWYGMYSGRGGDALSGGGGMVEEWSASLSGMQFSTRDQDNDRFLQGSCAQENMGGWWYNRCHAANLNGKFYRGGEYKGKYDNGVVWGTWKGLWYSLRHTTMKMRPLLFMDSMGSGAGADG